LVTSENNGFEVPTVKDNIGHGLEVKNGGTVVVFHSYKGNTNNGDGINQSGGSITIQNASGAVSELTGNKYNSAKNTGGNGFVKTGGTAKLYNFTIKDNQQVGINLNLTNSTPDPKTPDFIGDKLDIENNAGVGILLTQGNAQLTDITVTQNNADPTGGETKKYFNQVIVRGAGDASKRTLNIISGSNGNEISAGVVSTTGNEKSRSAVLIDSDSLVNIQGADISNNTDGYGMWVDAGTVILTDLTSQNNQRAIMFTQGNLTINNSGAGSYSDISNNTEYGIVAQDIDSTKPKSRVLLLNNVYLTGNTKGTSVLEGAGYGLAVLNDTQVTFDNSGLSQAPESDYHIADNTAGGIYIASSTQPIMLTGLTIFNNVGNGIDVNSAAAITLNISNSVFGNAPKNGETAQQIIGVNVKADSLTMTLDNTQITGQKADGVNVETKNDIKNIVVQNQSRISNKQGSGIFTIADSGNTTLNVLNSFIESNHRSGIHIGTSQIRAVTTLVNLTGATLTANGSDTSEGDAALYIYQKAGAQSTVNLTNTTIQNNLFGVHVSLGSLDGKIEGGQLQTNNLLSGVAKSGSWEDK